MDRKQWERREGSSTLSQDSNLGHSWLKLLRFFFRFLDFFCLYKIIYYSACSLSLSLSQIYKHTYILQGTVTSTVSRFPRSEFCHQFLSHLYFLSCSPSLKPSFIHGVYFGVLPNVQHLILVTLASNQ